MVGSRQVVSKLPLLVPKALRGSPGRRLRALTVVYRCICTYIYTTYIYMYTYIYIYIICSEQSMLRSPDLSDVLRSTVQPDTLQTVVSGPRPPSMC